ncbi:hypothetical protein [Emticicia sp. 21SJ11W-3]|uniref:hypothetical protein n=1 Tax=Emticicia sp. 21SJ11W-3 TaxID=2916755 RepID=UPI00209DA927|nr:hypothetical protein [Emticicia sp. 21SJ11W-3]UTA70167.1 hypothetical protein MB380_10170 [Emticicia sp. 21SJ11W-3]
MRVQPTLRIITDEVAIIDCLVDNGEMFRKFDTDKTAAFLVGEDFHLVLYLADSAAENRFVMYIVDDFSVNEECMAYVLKYLEEQIQQNHRVYTMKQARNKVLDIFYMTDTFRALFGKKSVQEEDEYHH